MKLSIFSLQLSLYSGLSFFSFLGVVSPNTRLGVVFIFVVFLTYLGVHTYQDYLEESKLMADYKAKNVAISNNLPDFVLVVLALILGIYLGVL